MKLEKLRDQICSRVIGSKIFLFDEVDSTNKVIDELVEQGNIDEGIVVISDSQTAGKGRSDRRWLSPKGLNLYISVLFKPDIETKKIPIFTFLSSCALKDTFFEFGIHTDIKWPNDILVKNRKLSGVLTEYNYSSNYKINYLVVGIGVNINMTSEQINSLMPVISNKVTSMLVESNNKIDREHFAARLIEIMDKKYIEFKKYGNSFILDQWIDKWGLVGERIKVSVDDSFYEGIAQKVDENGFLYIKTDDNEIKKIISGDMVF